MLHLLSTGNMETVKKPRQNSSVFYEPLPVSSHTRIECNGLWMRCTTRARNCFTMIRLVKKLYLILALSGIVFVVFLSNVFPVSVFDYSQNEVESLEWDTQDGPRPKTILFWTDYFDRSDYAVGYGPAPFVNGNCSFRNCVTTSDRSLLDRSDAVIFHSRNLDAGDLPSRRLPHQRFVFFNYEAPPNSGLTTRDAYKNFFNWTMTYRFDSDIVTREPYGQLEAAESPKPQINLSGKNRSVAWFVSHCNTDSQREWFVDELSKHIDVDIYGKCGQMYCDSDGNCQRATYDLLKSRYRFYLSFENSLCRDYVTEKLFWPMTYDVVPIVYGGANYSQFLPEHSYIDIRQYESAAKLAEYLHKLMKNDEEYLSYFQWRTKYRIRERPMDGWCQLCQKLNQDSSAKSYEDIVDWWASRTCRATPTFWGQPPSTSVLSGRKIKDILNNVLSGLKW